MIRTIIYNHCDEDSDRGEVKPRSYYFHMQILIRHSNSEYYSLFHEGKIKCLSDTQLRTAAVDVYYRKGK